MYKIVLTVICITKTIAFNYETLVVTTSGPIQGRLVNDLGMSYYAFQGIPYAENPVGDLRFKVSVHKNKCYVVCTFFYQLCKLTNFYVNKQPPVPKEPWSEILNTSESAPVCMQTEGDYEKDEMSENCLFLNIYVPANRRETSHPMPVLVYVHGGEFKSLSGNNDPVYGPQLLLKGDFIVITVNYRSVRKITLDNTNITTISTSAFQ